MARKVAVPKPAPNELSADRPLSAEVRSAVLSQAAIESAVLSAPQRTGTDIQSIKTDVQGLEYISAVNAKVLQAHSGDKTQTIAAVFGLLTFLFFAGLVLAAVFGKPVPPEARLLVIAVLALGVALSLGFLGGTASASGKLEKLVGGMSPLAFRVGGGVAVFLIIFLVGYLVYVRPSDDPVMLVGSVVDAKTSDGITATVIVKTDTNTYERQTTDSGDFRISDIPHLFNQEITVSARADNYHSQNPQTILVGSFVVRLKLRMDNCYNGIWHENTLSQNHKVSQWRFKLTGKNLHITRLDGTGFGDFHQEADGTWAGELSVSNAKDKTAIVFSAPNDTCNQIAADHNWLFARDTFE